MRYYNACVYDRKDNLINNTVIDVNEVDGTIVSVVSDSSFVPESGDYDCKGMVIYPSFMDSAVIAPGRFLFSSYGLDLTRYNTVREYRNAIEAYNKSVPIRGYGYNSYVVSEEGTGVLKRLLDEKYPHSPAYVIADDMTTAVVNECILDMAKEFFSIDRELHETGELDYYQLSLLRVRTHIFDFSQEEIESALLAFQYDLLSNGITTVRILDTIGGWGVVEAVKNLYESGVWVVTAVFNVPIYPFESEDEMWAKYQRYLQMSNQRMYITGVTLTMDGSIDSMQAALLEPYEGAPDWKGDTLWGLGRLSVITSTFIDAGIDVNIRAFGDRAVGEAVFALSGKEIDYKSGRRIITHAYLMSDEDISLCNKEGIMVCMEPNSIPYKNTFYEGDERVLGERCYDQYPMGRLVFSGVKVLAGSNTPTQPDINPIHGVYKAIHRVSADDVTVYQALIAYGESGYKSVGLWSRLGSLSVGKQASFVLLNKDIIHMNESNLKDTELQVTVVCGKVMYIR